MIEYTFGSTTWEQRLLAIKPAKDAITGSVKKKIKRMTTGNEWAGRRDDTNDKKSMMTYHQPNTRIKNIIPFANNVYK